MLETLFFKEEAENKYLRVFLFGILFSAVGIIITHSFLTTMNPGLISVFIASLGMAYPTVRYLIRERKGEENLAKHYTETKLLERHFHEILVYISLFLAVFIVFAVSGSAMPKHFFAEQRNTICDIRQGDCFEDYDVTGAHTRTFSRMAQNVVSLLSNNLMVFVVTFMLTFLISAGVVFVLIWNASVLGVFFADNVRNIMDVPALAFGYLPHGILEIVGYVIAGIAGAFLAYYVSDYADGKISKDIFIKVSLDIFVLALMGVAAIFIGAVIEATGFIALTVR